MERSFAAWAACLSQRTNRSLAGAMVIPPAGAGADFAAQAAQWGMAEASGAGGSDFVFDAARPPQRDMRTASGLEAMDHAARHMRVLAELMDRLAGEGMDLAGVRIAVCLVLEPKTAVLLRALREAGAQVGVFCEPSDTDQRVADQLRREGVVVEADVRWDAEETHRGALRLLDRIRPQIIIDDGASFARLAALERPELIEGLVGVAEETTSGVRAFEAMAQASALTFPVVAVNDSVLKTGFDNAHGTGETCVTTMQAILGDDAFHGARVTVVGYGPVGRGFATRVRALGARVTVCDTDPVAALKAVFDGFPAQDIDQAVREADIVVSATGVRHTIAVEHMRLMRPGTALAVIGGIANEIALDEVPGFTRRVGRDLTTIQVPGGPRLRLLAEGDGVNYTAGGGNPIEIMDLSFAVQVSAVAHLLATRGALTPGVHRLPPESDRRIATAALRVRGQSASHAVADNGYDWTLTRFADSHSEAR
ncbi:adenosylhomocysteinase [Bifidobacterium pullorum subsp. saeculare]|uniref:Adenosylhomocysteinase n=1 Tax=Bifidobacterium pullorum subsp. saeculare TaxID=78257 RepID=A0A939B9Q2_9BIFI|nr:adenosylhomocysteinase [Bifidobacterium pullorum]MBM6699769.1 adenosylhomocysteinase [Bifidobacterium pullorum subsp. saeculare]